MNNNNNKPSTDDTIANSTTSVMDWTVRAVDSDARAVRQALLQTALPDCQPQEGSPANTFTESEVLKLRASFPSLNLRSKATTETTSDQKKMDICAPWQVPVSASSSSSSSSLAINTPPQEAPVLDWHGAPRFGNVEIPRAFRQLVRSGTFTGPTNAQCPGFLQCNLVVLPAGPVAFDFLLFCQRNPQSCPLIEVCDVGSPCPLMLAPDADLRTDVPKYAIYRHGQFERYATDVTDCWPLHSVAFLIGCSFSYDGALMNAGIPLRSAEQGKNVPMFRTHLKCRSAGSLHGNMVVSMKPIPALQIAKHVEITSSYRHAHGGPVCIGNAAVLGITDISKPDWGEPIDVVDHDIPVFHACGVTPQDVLMQSKVPFAITHAPGHMFVTNVPSDMNC